VKFARHAVFACRYEKKKVFPRPTEREKRGEVKRHPAFEGEEGDGINFVYLSIKKKD